jgi:hypothetical protein
VEDGGEDEVVMCLYGCLYGWGRFVAFQWGACGMGWMGGWGVVRADLRPHVLLQREFLVLSGKGPPDILLVPLELHLHVRPRPVLFAGPDDEGVSGGGI